MNWISFFVVVLAGVIVYFIIRLFFARNKKRHYLSQPFQAKWRAILNDKVNFYQKLSTKEKKRFEKEVLIFLFETKITASSTTIDDTDRILIAASAVIPIFGFEGWEYKTLKEVIVYPDSFDEKYNTQVGERRILGMVGEGGVMGSVMVLSKKALHGGFSNESDKRNTAVHEFIHLVDKADGKIDGIPKALMEHSYVLPWIDLMEMEIEEICKKKSDIRPYGATSKIEFFTVAGEYFFERPKLMKRKHPELYDMLEMMFKQDMSELLRKQRKTDNHIVE